MNKETVAVMTPSMKLAELIELNYNLLSILSRLDIGLGFGEHNIEEICKANGINVSSFLLICHVYTYDDYVPSAELIEDATPQDIMRYLHNSHLHYLNTEMAKLDTSLRELLKPTDREQKKIVEKFFTDYKSEVENHFEYEELTVFPYVTALIAGKREQGYSMEQFEENHSNIDEKLNDLKSIVMKYLPDVCDTVLRNDVLSHIFYLEEDLKRHTLIEDEVLTPIVNRLEENE